MFRKQVEVPANPWAAKPFEIMTYDDLLAVKTRVDQEISSRGPGELEALKEKLTLIASAQGVSLADLFGVKPVPERKERKKREVRIRYRSPDNPDQTWSGLGRPKKWLQEKLDAGANLEEFAVA
jgi:DNA-binding protein H-NS